MWRRRNFRLLLSLIDQLPRDTKYRQAVSLDDEMAQLAVESDDFDDQPGDYRPDMSEDGTLSIALRDIGNQLRALRMDLVAVNGSRPQQIKMLEGPKTAIEIAAARKAWRDHYSLTARLLPHKAAEMQGKIAELSD